jgi:hypothetical protein
MHTDQVTISGWWFGTVCLFTCRVTAYPPPILLLYIHCLFTPQYSIPTNTPFAPSLCVVYSAAVTPSGMVWFFFDTLPQLVPYAVLYMNVTGKIWEGAANPTDLPPTILRVSTLPEGVRNKLRWLRIELIRLYNVLDGVMLLGLIMVPPGALVQDWHADALANTFRTAIARFQALMIPCSTGHRHTQFLNADYRHVASSSPEDIRDCYRSKPNWSAIERTKGFTEFPLVTTLDAIRWGVHVPHRGPGNSTNNLRAGIYAVFPANAHGKELWTTETQGVLYDVSFGEQLDEICDNRNHHCK